MPELPEVEDCRQDLEDFLLGRTIKEVTPSNDEKVLEGAPPAGFKPALEGRKIEAVGRKGKNLWLVLSGAGPNVLIHLGMDGEILIKGPGRELLRDFKYRAASNKGSASAGWPTPHSKISMTFTDGSALAFDEWRRFGKVRLVDGPPQECAHIAKLGFDPLTGMPPLAEFGRLLARRGRAKLKAVLLDQAFAAGIGNWVADEILWQARLHPEQPVGDMGEEHVARLHAAARDVVAAACAVRADAKRYPPSWMFHSRWTDRRESKHQGMRMAILTVGGRTSAYCPEVQRLVKGSSGGAGGGGKAAGGPPAIGHIGRYLVPHGL